MTSCDCWSHDGFLTAKGLAETAQRRSLVRRAARESLAGCTAHMYLDKVGSVSAMVEVEEDISYDAGHIELNRGILTHG